MGHEIIDQPLLLQTKVVFLKKTLYIYITVYDIIVCYTVLLYCILLLLYIYIYIYIQLLDIYIYIYDKYCFKNYVYNMGLVTFETL